MINHEERTVECIPVRITWMDHYSVGAGSWCPMDDIIENHFGSGGLEVNTVGYLIEENENSYVTISSFCSNGQTINPFIILKATVKEIEYLIPRPRPKKQVSSSKKRMGKVDRRR